jgi:hypothetical protein
MKSVGKDSRSGSCEPSAVGGLRDSDAVAKKPKFKPSKQSSPQNMKFDGTPDISHKNLVSLKFQLRFTFGIHQTHQIRMYWLSLIVTPRVITNLHRFRWAAS